MDNTKALRKAVIKATDSLFKQFGPESAVIVMVGIQDRKDHSAYYESTRGRCLPVEGLLVRACGEIKKRLWSDAPPIE